MKIQKSYMVVYENGTAVWYNSGKEFSEEGMVSKEERPVLFPDPDMMLQHKTTGEITGSVWLKDSSEDDWKEIPKSEADAIREEQEIRREIEIRRSVDKK